MFKDIQLCNVKNIHNKMKREILLILIFVILLFFPNRNFGQAPDLGAASSFALFTAAGAFDNVGDATYVAGDVGTNGGAFNAFPQGTLIGQKHVVDATSLQVATDVANAYSQLSGIACNAVIGIELGNQTLTPNVYCTGAASTLNGNLTLDGQGDPNALFIFKIGGALSVSTLSNVILTNSASLNNVYWQISGQFNLGASSVFRGTIISGGAISLLDGSSLEGRGLSNAGAISLDNNLVDKGTTPLPIELMEFIAYQAGINVQLNWSTASETNNNYFTVQRSIDGFFFEELLRIDGAGNSNMVLCYSAIDYNPINGTLYYRLKQTDFDGKHTYSNIVAVFLEELFDVTFSPNPFREFVTIKINNASPNNKYELKVYNILGTEVLKATILYQITTLDAKYLSSETYFFKLFNNNELIKSGKLISQN